MQNMTVVVYRWFSDGLGIEGKTASVCVCVRVLIEWVLERMLKRVKIVKVFN